MKKKNLYNPYRKNDKFSNNEQWVFKWQKRHVVVTDETEYEIDLTIPALILIATFVWIFL